MTVVPTPTGVNVPVADPIVATEGAAEVHTPPGVIELKEPVLPMQATNVPEIAPGRLFTDIRLVVKQPVGVV